MKDKIRIPKFEIEDIADAYTFYVIIGELPEDIFWDADISFVREVAANANTYRTWLSNEQAKLSERSRR